MNVQINPYIRRAWYDTLPPNGCIYTRVIFDYELLYIKDGKCTIQVEDQFYTPQVGDVFLFRPKRTHSIQVASDKPLIQPHIHFDLNYREDSKRVPISLSPLSEIPEEQMSLFRPDELAQLFSPLPDFVRPSDHRIIEHMIVETIFAHANNTSPLDSLRENYLFFQLLHRVLYEMSLNTSWEHSAKSETAKRVKAFLDHNNRRALSLDEIAANCYVSKYYMVSAFKEIYHITPHQYHQRQRINESKYLLRFTNFSVTEIAATMGFESIHAFSALFRHLEGISPNEYRKSM